MAGVGKSASRAIRHLRRAKRIPERTGSGRTFALVNPPGWFRGSLPPPMTARRSADFDLREAVLDPGFTPRARDAGALVDLLASGGELSAPAEQALLRLGRAAHPAVVAGARGRPAVVRLLGRLGAA